MIAGPILIEDLAIDIRLEAAGRGHERLIATPPIAAAGWVRWAGTDQPGPLSAPTLYRGPASDVGH